MSVNKKIKASPMSQKSLRSRIASPASTHNRIASPNSGFASSQYLGGQCFYEFEKCQFPYEDYADSAKIGSNVADELFEAAHDIVFEKAVVRALPGFTVAQTIGQQNSMGMVKDCMRPDKLQFHPQRSALEEP